MLCAEKTYNRGCICAEYQVNTAEFLATHTVFSLTTALKALDGHARKRVQHAVETGKVVQLRRELYATVPFGSKPQEFAPDRFLVMCQARPDAVLAGHSALELLGLAHSEWLVCSAYSTLRRSTFRVRSVEYKVVVPPSALVKTGQLGLGVTKATRGNLSVQHLQLERCIVDGFDRPRLFGGVVELVKSLDGARLLDLNLLNQLLDLYESRTLFGAVGWFLERNQRALFVSESTLASLELGRPASPHYLDRKSGNAVLAKRWNVLVPRELAGGEGDES